MSTFNQIYSDHINKICLVFSKSSSGSGLLFWYDTKLYLLTVKHILNNINNPIMYSISNVNIWNKDLYKYELSTQVLGFNCIGFDTTSDIAVCAYDSTLNINNNIQYLSTDRTFNKNYLDAFELSDFIDSRQLSIGDKICIIGQSKQDNNTMSSGIIKDNAYNGFPQNIEMVESILCDVASYNGSSGSPIINTNNKICGIVVGGFDQYFDHLTIGISSRILLLVIPRLIKKYVDFISKSSISDISKVLLSTTLQKCYFGIYYKHVNYNFFIKNNELQNKLKNIGGILVYDFIVGLNTLNNSIIYNFQKIKNSTINIHNPFQYNVITIQLTTNMTIKEIISTYKTPFIDLQLINDLLGYNENSIINTGKYINVFNNLNINTKLWQIYYDKIFKSHPLIFTKIWFTKDNYINNVNVGEWVDLNIGKYKGQTPLSDFVFNCSREIITDPIKNIPVYRFNTSNMANVVDKSNTKITNMVDVNGEVLTIGDIIIEFYYNISKSVDLSNNTGSWVGPVYQKIKPYVIYNKLSNSQNNTASNVLSIEQPSILNDLESELQIDLYYNLDIIQKRNYKQSFIKILKDIIFGQSEIASRAGNDGVSDTYSDDEIVTYFTTLVEQYNNGDKYIKSDIINKMPDYNDVIDRVGVSIPLETDDGEQIARNWRGFFKYYRYIMLNIPE